MRPSAGVAGWPIDHSLSPVLHRAWLAAAGIAAGYDPLAAPDSAAFQALVRRLRDGDLAGINVTAPWKGEALAAADVVAPAAARAGSANLLTMRDGRLRADSTDGLGLMAALEEQAPGRTWSGRVAVVLGAGGAARAAAAMLADAGAGVRIVNRTRDRAEALVRDLGGDVAVAAGLVEVAHPALVINALSAPPDVDLSRLPDDCVLMDMTYRPLETPFLAAGRRRGLTGVDGLAMLIGQARPSFEAFFGIAPPAIDIRRIAEAAL